MYVRLLYSLLFNALPPQIKNSILEQGVVLKLSLLSVELKSCNRDDETVRPKTGGRPMPQERRVEVHELLILVPAAIIGNRGKGIRLGYETAKS